MLTLLIRNFIVSLKDKEDAEKFLAQIESEINEKELKNYCCELRDYLASDSYHGQRAESVSSKAERKEIQDCSNTERSNEDNDGVQ